MNLQLTEPLMEALLARPLSVNTLLIHPTPTGIEAYTLMGRPTHEPICEGASDEWGN